eukprot:UN00554
MRQIWRIRTAKRTHECIKMKIKCKFHSNDLSACFHN